ncbi:MAG: NAD(P)/FAD-dependent oxidoreductase [Solirubrobacterales bacterium]
MPRTQYEVIIVGAGPAGIFCALELVKLGVKDILLLEKGKEVDKRKCPISSHGQCIRCKSCSIMSGWGGAGAFSDGKLTLTTEFGGWLDRYISKDVLRDLIEYVDQIYVSNGAPDRVFGEDSEYLDHLGKQAAKADLKLIPARIRHMGTENNHKVLSNFHSFLKSQITIQANESVTGIMVENGIVQGVRTKKGEYQAPLVVCAPGRDGAEWFVHEARRLKLGLKNNQVDIGVRVEVPAITLEHITQNVWESKIIYTSRQFDDQIRTFCMNPGGEVVLENTNGLITVNGHSFAERKSANTNFALLVSQEFTEPFDEPIVYGRYIAALANMLSGGVIIQRYGDLKKGRRSTPTRIERGTVAPTLTAAVPGDLSLVLPHRYMVDIMECLEALDAIAPGIASDHTLLYGIETKFYSARPDLSEGLESAIPGLYTIGDGAGVTRGLIQASVSGVVAARHLVANHR